MNVTCYKSPCSSRASPFFPYIPNVLHKPKGRNGHERREEKRELEFYQRGDLNKRGCTVEAKAQWYSQVRRKQVKTR